MALSKLLIAVKKSIFAKRCHNPLLGFDVGSLRIVDHGFAIETAMDACRLPPRKMANRAGGIDQKIDECLLIFRFDGEDVDLGDKPRIRL